MSAHVTASPRAQEQISEGPIKMENEIIVKKKKKEILPVSKPCCLSKLFQDSDNYHEDIACAPGNTACV